jgi:hypothetical protein
MSLALGFVTDVPASSGASLAGKKQNRRNL